MNASRYTSYVGTRSDKHFIISLLFIRNASRYTSFVGTRSDKHFIIFSFVYYERFSIHLLRRHSKDKHFIISLLFIRMLLETSPISALEVTLTFLYKFMPVRVIFVCPYGNCIENIVALCNSLTKSLFSHLK